MTIGQVVIFMEEIATITKLEWGEEDGEKSMTGEVGFAVAQRIFPKRVT